MKVFGLHGFLGLPSDFDEVFSIIKKDLKNHLSFFKDPLSFSSVHYLNEPTLQPSLKIDQWGNSFNRYIFDQGLGDEKKVLVGYSQGARLAMQAYQSSPQFWKGLILISGNPGVLPSEKSARLAKDSEWAERFAKGDFQKNIRDWNLQPVFKGSKNEPIRDESQYDRQQLALSLKNWSVAWQESFVPILSDPKKSENIFVAFGERDEKYKKIYQEIGKKNPRLRLAEIEDSGHRILFDQPQRLAKAISDFLTSPVVGE